MLKLILILFSVTYIEMVQSECSHESFGLYCSNLVNTTTTNSNSLIFRTKESNINNDVKAAYLRNSSGNIASETLTLFPQLQSLDIQFSSIDEFSPNSSALSILYIMNNSKFPKLTESLLKQCCKSYKILFIANNPGMEIETGAFKHLKSLTHLTISKQNITHLTKGFLEGLRKVAYLNLKHNGINRIDENAFEDLLELNHLDLSYNNYTNIGRKTFDNLRTLETLELYGLNSQLVEFDLSIFSKQTELKNLGLPTSLIKTNIELSKLTKTFPKLETIGLESEDKEDFDIAEFEKKCNINGFHVKFSSIHDLR